MSTYEERKKKRVLRLAKILAKYTVEEVKLATVLAKHPELLETMDFKKVR
jgi:hypothetical protein